MITVGIDMASQDLNTAACAVSWQEGRARVLELVGPANDDALLRLVGCADKVGVDVPLGWPANFAVAVAAHAGRLPWPGSQLKTLTHRATDHAVRARCGLWPLSVSSDRIALPAMRAARLFGDADRSGAGRLVEVYPAAALRCWGLPARGYKKEAGRAVREGLLAALRGLGWLEFEAAHVDGDHHLDALLCAVVARAAALGRTDPPPPELAGLAAEEGWIALPAGSLSSLVAP